MGYRDNIDIDLSEFGEGCTATIRDPRIVLRLADFSSIKQTRDADGDIDESAFAEEVAGRARALLARLIVSWTVWDVDTGELLPDPKGKLDVLSRCPEFVLMRIFDEVNARMSPLFNRRQAES